jgi:hypothetical protein
VFAVPQSMLLCLVVHRARLNSGVGLCDGAPFGYFTVAIVAGITIAICYVAVTVH